MSLPERDFSLETEYAINFYPAAPDKTPASNVIVQALQQGLVKHYGLPGCNFLVSGGKFHHDVGHAEWSLPECRTAREAATYDKAADYLLGWLVPATEAILSSNGFDGRLLIVKNNVDSAGNTYGCHENYLMQRDADLLAGESFLRYLARCLIPFLVTRQVFAGAGRLVSPGQAQRPFFELSQRAAFVNCVVSEETTQSRGIINLGREGEPLAEGNYRRLHLIVGDANLSGWATWMKLGTTGILLRMIEDLYIGEVPLLQYPVAALRAISRDPTCRAVVPLRDGRRVTAIDLQWRYYELADRYVEQFGCSDEENTVMDAWGQALEDLENDPIRLRNRADWAIKWRLLDTHIRRHRLSWDNLLLEGPTTELLGLDLRYHDVSPDGHYYQLIRPDTLVTMAQIEAAQKRPPPYTRARLRGEAIALTRCAAAQVAVGGWAELTWNSAKQRLGDPLEFDAQWLPADNASLRLAIAHLDPAVRIRAAGYLRQRQDPETLMLLAGVARQDANEQVRRAAAVALGNSRDTIALDTLIACLGDPSPMVRWVAEDALGRQGGGQPLPPRPSEPPRMDGRESLVHVIS